MGALIRVREQKARYSRVDLESSDPVWISVAQTGVVVKRSRLGLLGTVIYSESNLRHVVAHCRHLDALVHGPAVPFSDPVLGPYTRAALSARNMGALRALLSVPPLLESSYALERPFQHLQRFVNAHGSFLERASTWHFGYSEDLLHLPPRTIGEMLLVFATAACVRGALAPEIQLAMRLAYGQLALAMPAHLGNEAAAVADRLAHADTSVEREPVWDRVRITISTVFARQADREREFDRRLVELCSAEKLVDFSDIGVSSSV
jgi:hypothetical protein